MADPVQKALEKIAELVDDLRARTQVIEARLSDVDRKHESVTAAQRTWAAVMLARDSLVIASGAAETASVPVAIARSLLAGKALDVEVRDEGGDQVELVDARGRPLAKLPRAAFLALPRVVASVETQRLLATVHVQGVRTARTGRASLALSAPAPGARPAAGGPRGLDSVVVPVLGAGGKPAASLDSSGLAAGPARSHSGPVSKGGAA